MYESRIITALFFDFYPALFCALLGTLLLILAVWSRDRTGALIVLVVAFVMPTMAGVIANFPYICDYLQYFWHREKYVHMTICQVADARGSRNGLYWMDCSDGRSFSIKHSGYYYWLAQRWAQERQVVLVFYLPRSRFVLRATPVSGFY